MAETKPYLGHTLPVDTTIDDLMFFTNVLATLAMDQIITDDMLVALGHSLEMSPDAVAAIFDHALEVCAADGLVEEIQ